jgi:hypothetical protein
MALVGGINGSNWQKLNLFTSPSAGTVGISSAANGTSSLLPLTFLMGGSEKMRITVDGRIGIGSSNPGSKLEVMGGITSTAPLGVAYGTPAITLSMENSPINIGTITTSDGTNLALMPNFGNGNVGIGTTSPTSKLEVNGGIFINSDVAANDMFKIAATTTENLPVIKMGVRNNLIGNMTIGLWTDPYDGYIEDKIVLDAADASYIINGLAIGKTTISSGYSFDVAGKIKANEIVVVSPGADFVFEDNYNLRNLSEVETFIKQNKHLPEVPTATEVQENGVSLGEMQTKLLQKIEELTLYIIEQDKRIKELEGKNEN